MKLSKFDSGQWYWYLVHFMAGIGLAGFIFLTSCAPMKRHDRIVRKYPFVHKQDTVKIIDTVRITVPEVKIDTVTTIQKLLDTVVIEKENLKVKIWRIPHTDSIFIQGKCDTVTVEKVLIRKVPVNVFHTDRSWLKWVVLAVIFALLFWAFYSRFKEHEKFGQGTPPF